MAAARFVPSAVLPDLSRSVSISSLETAGIITVTLLVLGLAMLSSLVDRRFDMQALELALAEVRIELARIARIATMGELTASIAHEINQPLAAVVTNASASLRWLALQPPNLDEARAAATRTVREANRAGEVIGRIRALLKKAPPQMGQLQLNEVIQQVLALSRHELARAGITVQTELAPEVPALHGDRVQLQQVMLNLIMNAIDAMAVTTDGPRKLLIKSASVPEGVLVQVQDFGQGVVAREAERIFEPFFTTKPQGIGMGLSISRSIIEAHGGQLWVTPGSPHGAVFQFILPKAKSPK
jgi:C4-dicarboxylate-specific signal transduction histidine kinase